MDDEIDESSGQESVSITAAVKLMRERGLKARIVCLAWCERIDWAIETPTSDVSSYRWFDTQEECVRLWNKLIIHQH